PSPGVGGVGPTPPTPGEGEPAARPYATRPSPMFASDLALDKRPHLPVGIEARPRPLGRQRALAQGAGDLSPRSPQAGADDPARRQSVGARVVLGEEPAATSEE